MLQSIDNRADDTLSRLRDYIREGRFASGDRLPPERELVDRLGTTRANLRRALETLERSGAIWRHVGRGTFIGDGQSCAMAHEDAVAELGRRISPLRMMQARLCLEPALAREAAIHASGEAISAFNLAQQRARAAASWAEYEAQDDAFHHMVARASDNVLLLSLFDQLNRVRRTVAWGNVERRSTRPPADHTSFAEHEIIAAAIADRDPDRAWSAMRDHLKSVSERLFP